jgi:transposase
MSTSLLCHTFGLTDQEYRKTEYKGGTVIFHIKTKDSKLRCISCGSRNIINKGTIDLLFRTRPIGLRPVYLNAKVQRPECKNCGLRRQERLKYAEEKKLYPSNS